jgi:formaldehyde-activating enzyme involved in methanogenesis
MSADVGLTPAVARHYMALTDAGERPGPDTLARARAEAAQAAQGPAQRPTAAAVASLLKAGVIDHREARELLGLAPLPAPLLTPTFRRTAGYRHSGATMAEQAAYAAQQSNR